MKTTLRLRSVSKALILYSMLLSPLFWRGGGGEASAQVANGTGAGNCLSYDGVNDYVAVLDANSLDVTGAASFSAWVYLKAYPSVTSRLFSKWQAAQLSYVVEIASNGFVGIWFSTTGSNVIDGANNGVIPLNVWTHIAVVNNGTQTIMYVNGVAGINSNGGTFYASTSPLEIGGSTFEGRWMNGFLDEMTIWNRALTQAEIRDNMCKKLTGSESGLVGYWRFDEGSGGTAYDASGNGNNGTLY